MNKLEKEFKAQVDLHGEKIATAIQKVWDLSEKYGIPVAGHIPKSFNKYRGHVEETAEFEDWVEGVGPRFIDKYCEMGQDWLSSTVECEFNNGEY